MQTQDIFGFLEKFEHFLEELETKFTEDKNHRWFQNYIFMSEAIKENVVNYLNSIIETLKEIKEKHGETYSSKDISYHTDTALKYCESIKEYLREIVHLYRDQAEYPKIRAQWEISFGALSRNLKSLRGRLLIIKRILD